MKRFLPLVVLGCIWLTAVHTIAGESVIWIEGEDAADSAVTRHPGWYDKVRLSEMSGGDFLSHFSDDEPGEATYEIRIPADGTYHFWVHANPTKSKLSYKLNDGPWQAIDFSEPRDSKNIAADAKPDLRFIAWVRVATLDLTQGQHELAFRMDSDNHHHGAIDCFVLTTEPFSPIGTSRTGAADADPSQEGSWAFNPPRDRFDDDAPLDLRHLNEPVAGQHGFVQLTDDGQSFALGDGSPVRFWSVCSYGYRLSPEDMEHHARLLAKLGVNMVRIHARISGHTNATSIDDVDQQEIDGIFRFIKACKDNGIYLTVSPYWYPHPMPESWTRDLDGYNAGDMPTGALFVNDRYQQAYKTWVHELYTTVNPHTGLAIKDDPAVAIIQVKNEDSLLFYTAARLPEPQQRILSRKFADWLTNKHGSLDAALDHWQGARLNDGDDRAVAGVGDDLDAGLIGMFGPWHLTQPQRGGMQARLADQLQFTAELQRGFYAEIDRYLRDDLGVRQLTNAMNWKSADKLTLDDVERWTYLANDVVAVNRYAGGVHRGDNNGYRPHDRQSLAAVPPARAADQPQAGRRPTHDHHREHVGEPQPLSGRGPDARRGVHVDDRRRLDVLVRAGRARLDARPPSALVARRARQRRGLRAGEVVVRLAHAPGPVPRQRPALPQGLSATRRAGRAGVARARRTLATRPPRHRRDRDL